MDLVFIIKSLIGLVLLLGILVALLLYRPNKKKGNEAGEGTKKDSDYTLEELYSIIKDKHSTTKKLKWALDIVIRYHGEIPPKNGVQLDEDFYKYSEILLRICQHPNTKKELILEFDKALRELNPQYKKEINDFLTRGLNARDIASS
ncbi:hypothetical protein [Sulfurimonas marina]|uniref:Uncharacterized protein n=1 Tax=Sulfurimonas marina TaxID=2590551 RepID=A0A7M3V923_9BACT|nr:hypothetical protein [Sulfurimonas marina]QOP40256.1 hypothetical protein FJR03_00280 [Sulfurimonas marina]